MQYTETELAKLIETVETEFTAHLSKAEAAHNASLAKSEDGEKKEAKPASDKKPEEKAPEAEAKPAEAAPAAEAKPAEAAAPAAAAPAEEGHGYDPEDMEHMDKMYASMSRAELMAHHDSIRKALDAQGAQAAAPAAPAANPAELGKSEAKGKSELKDENPELNSKPKDNAKAMNSDPKNGGMEGQQPSGSPGAKSPASDASKANQMAKAEHARRNGGKIEGQEPSGSPGAKSPASTDQRNLSDMEKSESDLLKSELEAEKAKSAELKKNFDAVQEFLTKFVGKITAPKGKAITEVAALQKNEGSDAPNFSKAEITEKLLRKSSDPKLEKSDRAAINEFYATGQVNINSISHLLK